MNDRLLLTVGDLAEMLSVHPNTVRNLVAAGELPTVKIGRALRFSRVSVEQWIADRERRENLRTEFDKLI